MPYADRGFIDANNKSGPAATPIVQDGRLYSLGRCGQLFCFDAARGDALRPNVWHFLMEGLRVDHAVYGVYHPDYLDHVYRDVYLNTVVSEPINRGHDDESVQDGSFTYDRLTLENCRTGRDR